MSSPPDLDQILQDWINKMKRLFSSNEKTAPFRGKAPEKSDFSLPFSYKSLVLVILGGYLLSGLYIVDPAERAVVTQFGAYQTTVGPGPHWLIPLIQSKTIVNVDEVMTTQHGGMMLTKDENIVSVKLAVQYKVEDPREYLYNLTDPEGSLRNVVDSAVRYVIGHSTLDQILTNGRTLIAAQIKEQITQNLDAYHAGLLVSAVAMQEAEAPEEVKAAFLDAIRAREDEERLVNQAEAYASRIEPIARGQAIRLTEDAKAYKEQVSLLAKGETNRFNALLPEYDRGPDVMRDRLYIDAMQKVLSTTSKVVVNVKKGNPFVYLPLDKITEITAQAPSKASVAEEAFKAANVSPSSENTFPDPLRPLRPEQQDRVSRLTGDAS